MGGKNNKPIVTTEEFNKPVVTHTMFKEAVDKVTNIFSGENNPELLKVLYLNPEEFERIANTHNLTKGQFKVAIEEILNSRDIDGKPF